MPGSDPLQTAGALSHPQGPFSGQAHTAGIEASNAVPVSSQCITSGFGIEVPLPYCIIVWSVASKNGHEIMTSHRAWLVGHTLIMPLYQAKPSSGLANPVLMDLVRCDRYRGACCDSALLPLRLRTPLHESL